MENDLKIKNLKIINKKIKELKYNLALERIGIVQSGVSCVVIDVGCKMFSEVIDTPCKFVCGIAILLCAGNFILCANSASRDKFAIDELNFEKEKLEGKTY